MNHPEDFADYERELKIAKRNAKEAYVRYRSYYDALCKLPVKAADAGYAELDDLAQLGGELADLLNADFFV